MINDSVLPRRELNEVFADVVILPLPYLYATFAEYVAMMPPIALSLLRMLTMSTPLRASKQFRPRAVQPGYVD